MPASLARLLQRVVLSREPGAIKPSHLAQVGQLERQYLSEDSNFLAEIKDELSLPSTSMLPVPSYDVEMEEMDPVVLDQLRQYVLALADLYHPNSFHNWDHACHVAHSAMTCLTRVTSSSEEDDESVDDNGDLSLQLDDPMTQFAFVLSALIHDVGESFL